MLKTVAEIEITTRIRFKVQPELVRLILLVEERMNDFTLAPGAQGTIAVVGQYDDGSSKPVPATITSTDESVFAVQDNGDGSGVVTAVGADGGVAAVVADYQGFTSQADGTISGPQPPPPPPGPQLVGIGITVTPDQVKDTNPVPTGAQGPLAQSMASSQSSRHG